MSKKKAFLLVLFAMLLIFVGIWFFYPDSQVVKVNLPEGQTEVIPGEPLEEGVPGEDEITTEAFEEMIARTKTLPNSINADFVDALQEGPSLGEVFISSDETSIYIYAVLDVPSAPVGYDYIGWIMGADGIIAPAGLFSEVPEEGLMTIAQTDTTASTETFTSYVVTKQIAGAADIQMGEVLYKAVFIQPEVTEEPVVVTEEVE